MNADSPVVEVQFLDYPDKEISDLGPRGIGEIGLTGNAAAITDAVYHPTGVRVRELPVRIEDPRYLLSPLKPWHVKQLEPSGCFAFKFKRQVELDRVVLRRFGR